jgi:hypothetical protein
MEQLLQYTPQQCHRSHDNFMHSSEQCITATVFTVRICFVCLLLSAITTVINMTEFLV